jgi:hypothetical protein
LLPSKSKQLSERSRGAPGTVQSVNTFKSYFNKHSQIVLTDSSIVFVWVTRLFDWSRWFAISSLPSISKSQFQLYRWGWKNNNSQNLDVRNITSLILSLASLCVLGVESHKVQHLLLTWGRLKIFFCLDS